MEVTYKKIIAPLDGSPLAECVLPHVEAIARSCQIGTVELVRVVPPLELHVRGGLTISPEQEKELNDETAKEAEAYLNNMKEMLVTKGINATAVVLSGQPAKELAEYIEKSGADLVVISTHGRSGPSRWVWGSIADRLLHVTCTPILMIRAAGCIPGF